MKFVQKSVYSAFDWHNMATVITQMQQDGHYDIDKPYEFIAEDIYENISDYITSDITIDKIIGFMKLEDDTDIKLINNTKDDSIAYPTSIEFFSEKKGNVGYRITNEIGYTKLVEYYISDIECEDIAYIVSEHIVNPGKGCDLIERCYHEPFKSLEEAENYLLDQMKYYTHSGRTYHSDSGYKIEVVDKEKIQGIEWYKYNMLALEYMKKLNKNPEDYRFYRNVLYLVGELQEEIYQLSTVEERKLIDIQVINCLSDYLPKTLKEKYVSILSSSGIFNSREIADKALIQAFINAKSQNEYDSIHNLLGIYKSRVWQLTHNISKEHKGNGRIVVSKSGDIKWYSNGYGISSWEKANIPNNKYYGTLHYIMGGTCDCFKTYNPNNFVDELPSDEEVNYWENKYNEWEKSNHLTSLPF